MEEGLLRYGLRNKEQSGEKDIYSFVKFSGGTEQINHQIGDKSTIKSTPKTSLKSTIKTTLKSPQKAAKKHTENRAKIGKK